jgi:predicted nucleic acid-binding protein
MTVVVDASVALKWFVKEENTTVAVALLTAGERAIAPTLIVAELCNAAWRLWRRGEMAQAQVSVVAGRAPSLFTALVSEIELAKRASEISLNLEHPAYDCFYLALAEKEAAALVTADRRLVERVRATPWEGRVVALDAWAATA